MRRAAGGFTLIEVLLATVLLAAGLALAFASLRSATALTQRGEAMAQRNERMRAVEGFLRRRIASAQQIAFDTPLDTQVPQRFLGEPQRMRFVSDLPDYLGRGGPYLHDVHVEGDRLQVAFAMVQAGHTVQEQPPRPPELLAAGLRSVRFRYRGLAAQGGLEPWRERWERAESLPLQVAVEIEAADGRRWPMLVVNVAQSDGGIDTAPAGARR